MAFDTLAEAATQPHRVVELHLLRIRHIELPEEVIRAPGILHQVASQRVPTVAPYRSTVQLPVLARATIRITGRLTEPRALPAG